MAAARFTRSSEKARPHTVEQLVQPERHEDAAQDHQVTDYAARAYGQSRRPVFISRQAPGDPAQDTPAIERDAGQQFERAEASRPPAATAPRSLWPPPARAAALVLGRSARFSLKRRMRGVSLNNGCASALKRVHPWLNSFSRNRQFQPQR